MDNKKIYDFLKGNAINFVIILISLAYIFYQQVVIKRTDLTIEECIAKAGIGIIVGFLIKQGVGENGFNLGYRSEIWRDSLKKYGDACNSANPYMERVDNFYYAEEIEKKKTYRRTNLMNARMKYSWFFDKFGNYVENKDIKLTRKQKRVLDKCIKVKIYHLNLFSEYNDQVGAETRRERTDKDQRMKMLGKNSFSQIVVAIVGAYFVATWENWDLASFITASVQVTCWIACGLMQMYSNYNYVVIDKDAKLKRKMELIVKFKKGCEQGLYIRNPYDEIEEMEEQLENEQSKISPIPAIQHDSTVRLLDSEIPPIPDNTASEDRNVGDSSNSDIIVSPNSDGEILPRGVEDEIQPCQTNT